MNPEIQASELQAVVNGFVQANCDAADQLLPMLHQIQHHCGYVPDTAAQMVAAALNISAAEVAGVVSFYADFLTQPVPLSIEVCCAEACQACGAHQLYDEINASSPAGLTVRKVYCLGNCAAAPSARMGDDVLARVNVELVYRELAKR